MTSPIVSVVMPVYNVENYVAEAVMSVLGQTYKDLELIIVDDGGRDDSMKICEGFRDPRVRIVRQPNRGLAGARNTGIAAARGEFIALLDSDDRWDAAKLMLHIIHLQADPSVDVSYSGSRLIDAAGRPIGICQQPRLNGVKPHHILLRNPVGNGSAPVMRRSALDKAAFAHPDEPGRTCWFDESFRQSEDIEMWLRMAAGHGCRFEGIEGALTDYRIVGGGLSANVVRQFESWQRVMDKARGYAPGLIARHGAKAEAYQLRYLARRAVQLGDGSFAVSLMRQAVWKSPAIAIEEPVKTAITAAASAAARWLPAAMFHALARRHLGGAVSA
ncbi:glycosyltransferase family 2 protein [Novosphingobium beihaiensis]|uniref:Glycosyltransferase n=1 Tax=Novosphingobium beihaiensis TaxID=2930389 RepID=A0ABT0BUV0_9SPHN|nr:glycosyltransferase [Novosphingobium beihaiensis]MCJ2188848.1 glycosyltransferase [Novosphingobium beihaiensis]